MKHTCVLLFLIAIAQAVFPQDLIITTEDDQIKCKITKVTNKEIFYMFMQDGAAKDSSLSRQFVKEYAYDRFAVNDTLKAIVPKNDYHYRVALNLGLGYLMNLYPDDTSDPLSSYYMKLKSGGQVSGDVAYYLSGGLGIGLKYSLFNSKCSSRIVNQNQVQTGIMSDDITITFIGPSVSNRFPSINGNNGFIMDFSLGYMTFNDEIVLLNNYTEKGSTIGYSLGIGYDISLSRNYVIGIQLSMYTGRLTEYVMTDYLGPTTITLDKDSYRRLERLDLSIGFRFLK
jgi:hypothetical protein